MGDTSAERRGSSSDTNGHGFRAPRKFACVLMRSGAGSRLAGSAGLTLSDGRSWFSIELSSASAISAVNLLGDDRKDSRHGQLFDTEDGVPLRHAVGWLAAPDLARFADEFLHAGGLWLEVVTSEGTVNGQLREIAGPQD